MQDQKNNKLNESLEEGDLKRLVTPQIQIDRYNSKMGDDDDIVVVSFKVTGKNAANDLMNFLEMGYEYILDADVSSGEVEDGDYLVFMELSRRSTIPERVIEVVKELEGLTDIKPNEWVFTYYKNTEEKFPLTKENLDLHIPSSPKEYNERYEVFESFMDHIKKSAGIKTHPLRPRNKSMDGLRMLAGVPFKDAERPASSRTER